MFYFHVHGETDTVQTVMCSPKLAIFKKPQHNTIKIQINHSFCSANLLWVVTKLPVPVKYAGTTKS